MLYLNEGYTGINENSVVKGLNDELEKKMRVLLEEFYIKCKESNVCLDTFSYLSTSCAFFVGTNVVIDNAYAEIRKNAEIRKRMKEKGE